MEEIMAIFLKVTPLQVYLIMFGLLLACGMGLPLPEDITLISAGYIAYKNPEVSPFIAVIVGMLGVMIGDSFIYYIGRKYGMRVLKIKIFAKMFTPERIEKANGLIKKHGNKFIFITRFLAGLRAPIFFSCGTLKVTFKRFFFYDGFAALVSVPTLIYAAFYGGVYIDNVIKIARRIEYFILFTVIGLAIYFYIKARMKAKKKEKSQVS